MPHLPDHRHPRPGARSPPTPRATPTGPTSSRRADLVAACTECAALHHDLRAIVDRPARAARPARPRDFRLTPEQAASLRPAGWRGVLAALRRAPVRARRAAGHAGSPPPGIAGLLLASPGGLLPASSGEADRARTVRRRSAVGQGRGTPRRLGYAARSARRPPSPAGARSVRVAEADGIAPRRRQPAAAAPASGQPAATPESRRRARRGRRARTRRSRRRRAVRASAATRAGRRWHRTRVGRAGCRAAPVAARRRVDRSTPWLIVSAGCCSSAWRCSCCGSSRRSARAPLTAAAGNRSAGQRPSGQGHAAPARPRSPTTRSSSPPTPRATPTGPALDQARRPRRRVHRVRRPPPRPARDRDRPARAARPRPAARLPAHARAGGLAPARPAGAACSPPSPRPGSGSPRRWARGSPPPGLAGLLLASPGGLLPRPSGEAVGRTDRPRRARRRPGRSRAGEATARGARARDGAATRPAEAPAADCHGRGGRRPPASTTLGRSAGAIAPDASRRARRCRSSSMAPAAVGRRAPPATRRPTAGAIGRPSVTRRASARDRSPRRRAAPPRRPPPTGRAGRRQPASRRSAHRLLRGRRLVLVVAPPGSPASSPDRSRRRVSPTCGR